MIAKSKKNLVKKDIAHKINSTIGLPFNLTYEITDNIIDFFIDILIKKKKINIKNFGSFNISLKRQREGRNPKTKEKFIISERNTIKFKASNSLKNKIN